MATVSADKLKFKKKLSMIEQFAIKDFLYKWVGEPSEGLDEFLPLEYTEGVLAKMETKMLPGLLFNGNEYFRYATITEDNQIVIATLDSNEELKQGLSNKVCKSTLFKVF